MSVERLFAVSLPIIYYALPVFLGYLAWHLWQHYARSKYIGSLKSILLEVKLPKEILKTPAAMELVLNTFSQSWEGTNKIEKELKGIVRSWFSLELVSLGGQVHFYIRTDTFFKNLVESQIYAQYPEVEVSEADDYVHDVPYGLPDSDWQLWGTELKLTKEDAYPIKTYIDYGLDKPATDRESEATRVDPLTPVLEFLGSIGPGENLWIQILVQATRDRFPKTGRWFGKEGWKDRGKLLVEKLMQRDKKRGPEDETSGLTILSPRERQVVENIERSLSKTGFDCGIRVLYLAKKENFSPDRIVGLLGAFKQFGSNDLNGFKSNAAYITSFKYPHIQDPTGRRLAKKKAIIFDAYRLRSYFNPPYPRQPFVLGGEELATIYHFPGGVAVTPTLGKIESKRAEPPGNLPI